MATSERLLNIQGSYNIPMLFIGQFKKKKRTSQQYIIYHGYVSISKTRN